MSGRIRLSLVSAISVMSLVAVTQTSSVAPVQAAGAATFHGLTPARLLDTRVGNETFDMLRAGEGPMAPHSATTLQVSGRGGVPATGVGAVALNVTVASASEITYITVWPTGKGQPGSSNLNAGPGAVTPNMVIVPLGTGGKIDIANDAGSTELIVDVLGWFPSDGDYVGLVPARFLDTRPNGATVDDAWVRTLVIGSGSDTEVLMSGRGEVPETGAESVAVNITVTGPTKPSYMTVWPSGQEQPNASTVNYEANATLANMAIVPIGAEGKITLWNNNGFVFGIVDVLGYFPTGSGYHGISPERFMDTRAFQPTADWQYSGGGRVAPNSTTNLQVTGRGSIPATGVGAVALNVTVANPTLPSFMTVWPNGIARPNASNLNFSRNQTVANMVIVPVGANGQISLYNSTGQTDVLVDVLGWFAAS